VNKLGDPCYKVAAHAAHLLTKLGQSVSPVFMLSAAHHNVWIYKAPVNVLRVRDACYEQVWSKSHDLKRVFFGISVHMEGGSMHLVPMNRSWGCRLLMQEFVRLFTILST